MIPHLPDYIAPLLAEAHAAEQAYGPFASAHEAMGVLLEEMRELSQAIHQHSLDDTAKEALQVAAVAYRLAVQCQRDTASEAFRERSRLS